MVFPDANLLTPHCGRQPSPSLQLSSPSGAFCLSCQELRQSPTVIGTEMSGHGEHCKGPGDNHLMATGQGHTEAWSSCPSSCSSAGRGKRQGREERGCQPALSPPPPRWAGPVALSC